MGKYTAEEIESFRDMGILTESEAEELLLKLRGSAVDVTVSVDIADEDEKEIDDDYEYLFDDNTISATGSKLSDSSLRNYYGYSYIGYEGDDEVCDEEGVALKLYNGDKYLDPIKVPSLVVVPEIADYEDGRIVDEPKPVLALEDGAFENRVEIHNMILPDTIYYIGAEAFSCCINLESIKLPDGLRYIASEAFCNCQNLRCLVLPSKLKAIGELAFANSGLVEMVIPHSVERIGPLAFQNSELETLVITNPNIQIDYTAFDSCDKIKRIVAPLELAGWISVAFNEGVEVCWINGSRQIPCRDVIVEITSIEQDSYTDGTSGVTINYTITNNSKRMIVVTTEHMFIVRSSGMEVCHSVLKNRGINNFELQPNYLVRGAYVLNNDKIKPGDFSQFGKIGIAVSIDWQNYDWDMQKKREQAFRGHSYSPGDWTEVLELHWNNYYTAAFMKVNEKWEEIVSTLPLIPVCEIQEDNSEIEFADFVVRVNLFRCNHGHHIEPINAYVKVLRSDGTITTENVSAGYCQECKCYFILESDFMLLQHKGVLLCHLITEEEYRIKGDAIMSGQDMKAQSVLRRCGYTVNAKDDLSEEQRQGILIQAVESGLYSIPQIVGFLDWLADYHGRSRTRNMSSAIDKWRSDRRFISSYKIGSWRNVGIGSIHTKKFFDDDEQLPF